MLPISLTRDRRVRRAVRRATSDGR
jgi:hypothetical protein